MFLAKPMGILPPYMDTGKMLTIYNNQVAKSQFGSLLQAIARRDSRPRKGAYLFHGQNAREERRLPWETGSRVSGGRSRTMTGLR